MSYYDLVLWRSGYKEYSTIKINICYARSNVKTEENVPVLFILSLSNDPVAILYHYQCNFISLGDHRLYSFYIFPQRKICRHFVPVKNMIGEGSVFGLIYQMCWPFFSFFSDSLRYELNPRTEQIRESGIQPSIVTGNLT